jgi:hypothetical protein
MKFSAVTGRAGGAEHGVTCNAACPGTARGLHERTLRDQADQIAQYLHPRPDGNLSLDLPDSLRQLYSAGYERYGFAIATKSGYVLFSTRAHDEPLFAADPRRDQPSYFEDDVGSSRMFGASVPTVVGGETLWIQISQDQAHRDVLIDDIVAEFLPHVAWVVIPILLVLACIDLIIFGRALQPLMEASTLAQRISRARTDLRLPEVRMPQEVAPLVRAVNEAPERLERGFITSLPLAFRSDMFAGSTRLAIGSPRMSTRMCRFLPFTRLCPSNPRMPPTD